MGTYAEIIDGKVNQVLVVNGTEEKAIAWLNEHVSTNLWVKTEEDGSSRNKYAGKGDEYIARLDAFVVKKPFESWILDEERLMYIPPIPKPLAVAVGYVWKWSQELGQWVQQRLDKL